MPFATTIAELIAQQGKDAAASRVEAGRIAANALTSNAQAASDATRQKGLIWGGAINQIGQSIGAIPGQIQHAKALDLQNQDVTAQIAERQAKVKKDQDAEAESAAVDAAFAASVKPDGSVDTQKFLSGVPGSKQQIYAPMVETLNKNAKAMQDAKESSIAHGLYAAYRDGTPESLVNVGKMMVGSKAMQPEELAQLQQVAEAIKSSPSETQKTSVQAVAAHLGGSFPQFSDLLDKGKTQEAALAETAAKTNEANARAAQLSRPQLPTEASLADAANPGNPAGALAALKTPKAPPSMDEQLLEAISKGDTVTATRIKQTLHDAANARKDPAAAAMANELGALRASEAQVRLDAMRKKNEPLDIAPDVQTTASGKKYIDGSSYQGEERNKARESAGASGVTMVSKEQANALQEIDNARANQKAILDQIGGLLPKDPSGRVLSAPATKLETLFQTNDQKAAFSSWRTAAIQTLRATAGSKGLRINQAEIQMAIENDLPKLTDTLSVAQQKVKNISTMLDNAENSIVVKDRAAPATGKVGKYTFTVQP